MRLQSLKPFLDELRTEPERRTGIYTLSDLDSFCEHVNKFKDDHSLVFLDRDAPAVTALYDAHRGGPDGEARFEAFGAHMPLPFSDEYLAWQRAQDRKLGFTVDEFALFLDERFVDVVDVVNPEVAQVAQNAQAFATKLGVAIASPQDVLALSGGLEIHSTGKVVDRANTNSGERTLTFVEEHKDGGGGKVKVPSLFLIQLPIFEYAARSYVLPVRLRYRVSGGQVRFFVELHRIRQTVKDAFRGVCDEIEERTKVVPLWGKPGQHGESGARLQEQW
jgi:hypothetical protein